MMGMILPLGFSVNRKLASLTEGDTVTLDGDVIYEVVRAVVLCPSTEIADAICVMLYGKTADAVMARLAANYNGGIFSDRCLFLVVRKWSGTPEYNGREILDSYKGMAHKEDNLDL